MENETWMNARKAVELGFADGILEDEKKTAAEPFMFSTKETDNALWGRITAKVTKDQAMSVVAKNATTDEPVPQGRKISELMSELQKIKKFI